FPHPPLYRFYFTSTFYNTFKINFFTLCKVHTGILSFFIFLRKSIHFLNCVVILKIGVFIPTKKAVIVKLLLVYLITALRKLHNTLLASYGLTHLFDLFWHSLNIHFVQRALLHTFLFVFEFSDC